eukprot:CAMPEP_0185040530 /NCGR_PEP_ID=MMETSP1103-20130426/38727_1 /TAXON_ID=36769 /ORGANISM="Paraphysomonas bandaiensis, Strain Caron Lab Isolate" /LENGTH=774 /DNA_ID=CAMNT_0027579881 /DNA_START=309 /DNA_END=2633 /DNA_ORIENTATION=+
MQSQPPSVVTRKGPSCEKLIRSFSSKPSTCDSSSSLEAPQQSIISFLAPSESSKRPSTTPHSPTRVRKRKKAPIPADTSVQQRIDNSSKAFHGIEKFCRNAGSCEKGLNLLVNKCQATSTVAVAVVWTDGTSSHADTSRRLCVPSRPCPSWNCTCDRHIRSQQAVRPLLGAVFCLSSEPAVAYFLPLKNPSQVSVDRMATKCWVALWEIMACASVKVMYNSQLALIPLHAQASCCDKGPLKFNSLFDPRVAEYLCDTTASEQDLELRRICDRLKLKPSVTIPSSATVGPAAKVVGNVFEDLQCLVHAYSILNTKLSNMGLLRVFSSIEMPLASLLAEMELRGLSVSLHGVNDLSHALKEEITELESTAHNMVQQQFNLSSPDQVANLLYDRLQLSTGTDGNSGRDGKKHASTSEEALLRIKEKHPVVEIILNHRYMTKILGTFVEGIRPFIVSASSGKSRIHAYWNQTTVRTGRLSCTRPNLQNIPNGRTVRGIAANPRALFTASDGRILVSADYSQIEMRVLAHVCGDSGMVKLFRHSGDIYQTLASIILDRPPANVTPLERERAKVVCLGVIYGMGPQAAAARLNIDVPTVNSIIRSFYGKFNTVKQWISNTKNTARQQGLVRTILGRIRSLPDMSSTCAEKRSQAERQAVNSIIQGSASDIIKYAMLRVERELSEQKHPFGRPEVVMQIHDELIYDVPERSCESFVGILRTCMENQVREALGIVVPLIVNIRTGKNWGSLTPINIRNLENEAMSSCTNATSAIEAPKRSID